MKLETDQIKWGILGLLITAIILMTFSVSPDYIRTMLTNVTVQVTVYSLVTHIALLLTVVVGLFIKNIRNQIFTMFIMFISLSGFVASIIFAILPNMIIFGLFAVLIANSYLKGELNFDFSNLNRLDILFGTLGIVFSFWYLHWVEEPIWLNALLYSPLGTVNCPTMLVVCAFLCLSGKSQSKILATAVSLITLYFGFFGIFILNAYVDIILIACSLYLLYKTWSGQYNHSNGSL